MGNVTIVVLEADEARILDAVALAGCGWKNDALRNVAAGGEAHFVVRLGQQQDAALGVGDRRISRVRVLERQGEDTVQIVEGEDVSYISRSGIANSNKPSSEW